MNAPLNIARKFFSYYKTAKLRRMGQEPSWQRVHAGFEMWIDPNQWLDQRMLFGVYEPWESRLIHQVVRDGEVCFDIGAHKGFFSLQMAKQVGADGSVLSFEPDPRAYGSLDKNRSRNELNCIQAFPLALGEQEGEIEIRLSQKLGDASRFERKAALDPNMPTTQAKMKRLDDVINETDVSSKLQKLSFIKMDAEGSEPAIFDGMENTLSNSSPILSLEFNFECLQMAGSSANQLKARLETEGFSLYRMLWTRKYFLQGVLQLQPLYFNDQDGETVDAVAVKPNSPFRNRIQPLIVE